jgi:hypothetical protein
MENNGTIPHNKEDGKKWAGFVWCFYKNQRQALLNMITTPQGSTEGREFHHYLRDFQLLKKDSAPWS